MSSERRVYRWRGVNLDFLLTLQFGEGFYISIEARDKQGTLLETMEFRLDQQTVNSWLRDVARRAVRSALHL